MLEDVLRSPRLARFWWLAEWADRIERITGWYQKKYQRRPRLFLPVLFSEKLQWRKLFDPSPLYTRLCDKVAVRSFIAERGLAEMLIPTLWLGDEPEAIPFDTLERPFILKSTHASGHLFIAEEGAALHVDAVVAQARTWLNQCHGRRLTEPGYLDVPHRLIVEPLLRDADGKAPTELKVFVFDGVARFLQCVLTDANRARSVAYLSRNWENWHWKGVSDSIEGTPPRPARFREAIAAAETLGRGIDHCRVDFYVRDEQLFIGELTLYSWSGMPTISPPESDAIMGEFWTVRRPLPRAVLAILTTRWGARGSIFATPSANPADQGGPGARRSAYRADIEAERMPDRMTAGETRTIAVTVRNTGPAVWDEHAALVLRNAWSWQSGNFVKGPVGQTDGRVGLPALSPGAAVTLALPVTAPMVEDKRLKLLIDLSDEEGTWTDTFGHAALRSDVEVLAPAIREGTERRDTAA